MQAEALLMLFLRVRIIVLGLLAAISLAWAIFLSVFLSQEWHGYNVTQRIVILSLLAAEVVLSIFLYLMVIVRFRIFPDAAWTAFFLLYQTAVAMIFSLFRTKLPCIGHMTRCMGASSSIEVGLWILSVFVFCYGVFLLLSTFVYRASRGFLLPHKSSSFSNRHISQPSAQSLMSLVDSHKLRDSITCLPSRVSCSFRSTVSLDFGNFDNTLSVYSGPSSHCGPDESAGGSPDLLRKSSIYSAKVDLSLDLRHSTFGRRSIVLSPAQDSNDDDEESTAVNALPLSLCPRGGATSLLSNLLRDRESISSLTFSETSTADSLHRDFYSRGFQKGHLQSSFVFPPKPSLHRLPAHPPPPYITSPMNDPISGDKQVQVLYFEELPNPFTRHSSRKNVDGTSQIPLDPCTARQLMIVSEDVAPVVSVLELIDEVPHDSVYGCDGLPVVPPPTARSSHSHAFHRRSRTTFIAPSSPHTVDIGSAQRLSHVRRYGSVPSVLDAREDCNFLSTGCHILIPPVQRAHGSASQRKGGVLSVDYGEWRRLVLAAAEHDGV